MREDRAIATKQDEPVIAQRGPAGWTAPGAPAELAGWTYPGLDYSTFRLVLVAKAIDRLTLRKLSENCDLTIAEWRVLSRLAPIAGATVGQVAEMAWVDRAEVSRAAVSLEAKGFTARRANPQDGRSPILFCTEAGQGEYARVLPMRAAFHERLADDLTAEERATFDGLLMRIAQRVAGMAGEG